MSFRREKTYRASKLEERKYRTQSNTIKKSLITDFKNKNIN